jgi:hypothetical protein
VRRHVVRFLDRTRLGLRGAFLLGLAEVDLVYGAGLLFPSEETRHSSAYAWRQEFLPTEAWGAVWMAVGVFLITQAWSRRDRPAFTVAIVIKLVWAVVAVGSWIAGPVGQGWQTAGLFFGFAWVALVMALVSDHAQSRTVLTMPEDHGGEDEK